MKKKPSLFFTLYIVLFCCITSIYSQQRAFKHYGFLEGLPQETIRCMAQDSSGFLWLGSSAGISRFDGTNFFIPPEDNKSGIDLTGFKIETLVNHQSNLFVGTAQNGLYVYNTKNQTTRAIGIPDAKCTGITTFNSQLLVSYYDKGMFSIDKNYQVTKLSFLKNSPKKISAITQFQGRVYLGTDTGGLYHFNVLDASKNKIELSFVPIPAKKINRLVVIDNTLWVCSSNGLYKITNNNNNKGNLFSLKNYLKSKDEPFVTDVVKKKNTYFIGSKSGLFEIEQTVPDTSYLLKKLYVASKKEDQSTVSYTGTYDLFIKDNLLFVSSLNLDITSINTEKIFTNPIQKFKLNNTLVFSVITTQKYLFTGSTSGLVISEISNPSNFNIFPIRGIRGFTIDNTNTLWIVNAKGAYVLSLDNIDIEKPNLIKLPVQEKKPNSLSSSNLRSVYKDLQGTIWITTFENGINRFTGNISDKIYTFQRFAVGSESDKLPSPFLLSIVQDTLKNYWVSTQKGLSKLIFENGNFNKPVYKTYNKQNGLPINGVLSSFVDKKNVLWVATRKGLAKYLREEERFIYYGKKDGLTNTFVYHIIEDEDNNLWLSTNGGIFKFNKTTQSFANYTPIDGVQSLEFNLGAFYKSKTTNEIYFGGVNGINIFNPKKVSKLDKESKIQFTSIKIKDTLKTPNNFEGLDENITHSKKLTINFDDFPLDLSFAALDYRPNKNIQYVYKLLPDDKQWNPLNNKNNLQLLTLSPKTYTLQIQGMSRGKIWNQHPLELQIHVNPPWYISILAYFLYLLAFLSLVYLFYKITLQKKLAGQESKRLQDLDNLKTRFITNITHEFRTPLTIILGYLENLKEQYSSKQETINALETIEKSSYNLLNLVNQMLDLAKLEQGKLHLNNKKSDVIVFIKYIVTSFLSIAEEKNTLLSFTSKEKEILMDYDPEKLRQIITNLLSNALKFTSEEKKVAITLSQITKNRNLQLKIEVKDQGCGISDVDLIKIFDRFYQAQSDTFKVSQGTGIGLALTKELTHLMKGSISVVSEIGTGSTFTVLLPITQNAQESAVNTEDFHATIGKTEVLPAVGSCNKDADNHILIVEDNTDMANYISSCLSDDYQITHAPDGSKGLEKAMEQIPDLIISDVMMPVMDGFEMTQKLQQNEATNHIPIIILTSKAMQEEKIEGLESGADAYLTKPFSKKELQIRIANLIAKRKKLQELYQTEVVVQQKKNVKASTDKNIIFLNKAIDCIHLFIEDNTFNSEKLAKELGLSDSQLYRKLKAISNTSTAIFIRNIRLEKAKELLQTTDLTISEIAYATGFNDPSWFSKTFKTTFGESPTEIRK